MPRTYDHRWERVRLKHLRAHRTCVACGADARHVDHIVTVRAAPWRRLDPTNLQSLCHACHNRVTVAYDNGSLSGACDEFGLPLDPSHPWRQASNAKAIAIVNDRPRSDPMIAARLKQNATRRGPGGRV